MPPRARPTARRSWLFLAGVLVLAACARKDAVVTALAPPDAGAPTVAALLAADIEVAPDPPAPPPDQNVVPADCGAARAGQVADPFVATAALTGDAEVRAVLEELAKGPPTRALADRLRATKAAAAPALAKTLWAANPNLRANAATLLAELEPPPTPEIAAALTRALLFEPMAAARVATARALVDYKVEATVPALIEMLGKDTDENARSHAAYALGAMRARQAVPALVKSAQDPVTWVRIRSVTALGRIGGKDVQPALQRALRDPNDVVRQAAQRARGR